MWQRRKGSVKGQGHRDTGAQGNKGTKERSFYRGGVVAFETDALITAGRSRTD